MLQFESILSSNEQIFVPKWCQSFLQKMAPRVIVKVEKWEKRRSSNQNSYWFAMLEKYILPAFRANGSNWSAYKLHKEIMAALGYTEVLFDPRGKEYEEILESHKFTTIQWEEFMERARAFLMEEYQLMVPLPNEVLQST